MKKTLIILVVALLATLLPFLGGSMLIYRDSGGNRHSGADQIMTGNVVTLAMVGGNPRAGTRLGDSPVAFSFPDPANGGR